MEKVKEEENELLGRNTVDEKEKEKMRETYNDLKKLREDAEKTSIEDMKSMASAEKAVAEVAKMKMEDNEIHQKKMKKIPEETSSEPKKGAGDAPPEIKISPSYLFSKRSSSSSSSSSPSDAVLAAMAAVGLDTEETRAYLKAKEKEAKEALEKEKNKKKEEEEDPMYQGLTLSQKRALMRLEVNQDHVRLMEEKYEEEVARLRQKFDQLLEPIFEERTVILNSPPQQENEEEEEGEQEEEERKSRNIPEVGTQALPGFWLRAMEHHEVLSSMLGSRDKPLLLYLRNIRRGSLEAERGGGGEEEEGRRRIRGGGGAEGFKLFFEFDENPFFTPLLLTKSFKMKEDNGDLILSQTIGTKITWQDNMDVTKSIVVRKQFNMRTRDMRLIHEEKKEKSFFRFFEDSYLPEDDQLEAMTDQEQDVIFSTMKSEYDAGLAVRDEIIPNAVNWYLGRAEEETEEETTDEEEAEAEEDPFSRNDDEETSKRQEGLKKRPSKASKTEADGGSINRTGSKTEASSFAGWFGF
ncbi:nucleosome assembly protein [Cystoisospora suis]|uniref:Nucleosome assembly protein n=1 Tax=Cystoisospora suis TaxID=483139 RepID=A0A2C6L6X5_9APIC|nr:nucleosome assembly protein [Cystoisospora suis]